MHSFSICLLFFGTVALLSFNVQASKKSNNSNSSNNSNNNDWNPITVHLSDDIAASSNQNVLINFFAKLSFDNYRDILLLLSPRDRLAFACVAKAFVPLAEVQDEKQYPHLRSILGFIIRNGKTRVDPCTLHLAGSSPSLCSCSIIKYLALIKNITTQVYKGAVDSGNERVFRTLLSAGAVPSRRIMERIIALKNRSHSLAFIRLVHEKGLTTDTIFLFAVKKGYDDIVEELLHGKHAFDLKKIGDRALYAALCGGSFEIFKIFIKAGIDSELLSSFSKVDENTASKENEKSESEMKTWFYELSCDIRFNHYRN